MIGLLALALQGTGKRVDCTQHLVFRVVECPHSSPPSRTKAEDQLTLVLPVTIASCSPYYNISSHLDERINGPTALSSRSSNPSQVHAIHRRPFQFCMFKSLAAWSLTMSIKQQYTPRLDIPAILVVVKRLNAPPVRCCSLISPSSK